MAFYLSTKSMPELRQLPSGVRKEVVKRAMRTCSVTFRSGLLIAGYVIACAAVCAFVGINFGWLTAILLIIGLSLFGQILALNLFVRPRIREILGDRHYAAYP